MPRARSVRTNLVTDTRREEVKNDPQSLRSGLRGQLTAILTCFFAREIYRRDTIRGAIIHPARDKFLWVHVVIVVEMVPTDRGHISTVLSARGKFRLLGPAVRRWKRGKREGFDLLLLSPVSHWRANRHCSRIHGLRGGATRATPLRSRHQCDTTHQR